MKALSKATHIEQHGADRWPSTTGQDLTGRRWSSLEIGAPGSGPSTDSEVVRTLQKGERVTYVGREGDWIQISGGSYVHADYLTSVPPPPLEIKSWNWRKDPSFGIDGSVIWTAEIQNNTSQYIDTVWLEFTSYDKDGNVMTTDTGLAQGLSPGGVASAQGYATYYGGEDKARLRIR